MQKGLCCMNNYNKGEFGKLILCICCTLVEEEGRLNHTACVTMTPTFTRRHDL